MKIIKGLRSELEFEVINLIAERLSQAIKEKGVAVFAVPGGSSPVGIFKLLHSAKIDWKNVHVFLADERWVALDDEVSNYKNLQENLTLHIDTPKENVHYFDIKKGEDACVDYQKQFENVGAKIDVCLLGVGPDGHVASLFPNHPVFKDELKSEYQESARYIEVHNSPKPPLRRISLSRRAIVNSGIVILLVFGEEKRQALQNITEDTVGVLDCPAKIAKEASESYLFTNIDNV